jgi:hypothetical protein
MRLGVTLEVFGCQGLECLCSPLFDLCRQGILSIRDPIKSLSGLAPGVLQR